MPNLTTQIPISQLPPITAGALTDIFPCVQSGVTYKQTTAQIRAAMGLPYPPLYAFGFNIKWISTTVIQLSAGLIKSLLGIEYVVTASTLNIDITVSGAGGLDTGTAAGSSTYAVYVIWDKNNVNPTKGLFSLGFPTPTVLPAGYTDYRRVGWWMTNNTGDLFLFSQRGLYNQRKYFYQDVFSIAPASGGRRLYQGLAAVDTVVDCSTFIPPGCNEIGISASIIQNGASATAYIKNNDFSNANHDFASTPTLTNVNFMDIDLSTSTMKFSCKVTDGGGVAVLAVDLTSFVDYI